MSTGTNELMVTGAELAADFGISDSELARLARQAVIPRVAHPEERRSYLYPLHRCIRAYVEHLRSEELLARQTLLDAKSKREVVRTKRDELRLEIDSGLLVRRDLFFKTFEPLFISFRQTMLSRQTRLERRLSRAKSREARLRILTEDARATLATLGEVLQNGGNGQNGQNPKKTTL